MNISTLQCYFKGYIYIIQLFYGINGFCLAPLYCA